MTKYGTSAAAYRNRVAHQFAGAPMAQIGRSSFSRSHGYKTTFDADYLYPFMLEEVLPGDTWKVKTNSIVRVESMLKPIMDNLYLETFYFFVPNRLIWDNFERFMGQQDNPSDSIDYLIPTLAQPDTSYWGALTLADYFGLPVASLSSTSVAGAGISSLPFRAYALIYNQWFRDENLCPSVYCPKGDGPDTLTSSTGGSPSNPLNGSLLKRAKAHDYFTSSLPWPQKGPAVDVPLGDVAPIGLYDTVESTTSASLANIGPQAFKFTAIRRTGDSRGMNGNFFNDGDTTGSASTDVISPNWSWVGDKTQVLLTDLSEASAVSINSLRQAFQLQKFYERMARGGSRYIEIIKAHFGVTSPDARLQRSEYLGGNSQRMAFTTVAQTSSTDTTSPQANLSAFGIVGGNIGGFTRSFVEHGWIIGLFNIRADLTYQQGINKKWLRRTREDFYWPTFAHLGEQAVLNKEIFAQGTVDDDKVFGYQERFAEYRYAQSIVTGELRSSYTQSLDIWHLAQDFETLPALNQVFIESSVPMSRIVAVPSRPAFVGDFWHEVQCVRPMPLYGTPGLVDHF